MELACAMYKSTLTRRIIILISISLLTASYLILHRSESILETALLDQTKQQAHVFLLGLESQLQAQQNRPEKADYQTLVNSTIKRDLSALDFSIYQIYFFDKQGQILAHSRPGDHPPKKMKASYLAIFNNDKSLLGNKIAEVTDPANGQLITKTDIIIPFHFNNKIIAALEVEIDVEKTLHAIKKLDNQYEQAILLIISISGALTLLLIWSGVRRWLLVPIVNMGALTKKISQGDLKARLAVTSKDELGQLCFSINKMADSIESLFNAQEEEHLQMLHSLARALEAKDSYTAGHSGRVAKFSVQLGQYIGVDERQLKLLKHGALMHDLGKIGITDEILNKPSPLNDDEYEIMKQHPANTAKIMKPLKRFKEFTEIAAWHHERWDGGGYPDGLKGEQIPLLARIVCIADTWDAMIGDRIYRKGIPVDKALSILDKEKDHGQWDPTLIRAFIEMIKDEISRKS